MRKVIGWPGSAGRRGKPTSPRPVPVSTHCPPLGRGPEGHSPPALAPPGLKAFRQQLRKSARTRGFLGLNKLKGLARQVCQASPSRAARGGPSALQLPAQSLGLHSGGAGGREGRGLLQDVLHQQR